MMYWMHCRRKRDGTLWKAIKVVNTDGVWASIREEGFEVDFYEYGYSISKVCGSYRQNLIAREYGRTLIHRMWEDTYKVSGLSKFYVIPDHKWDAEFYLVSILGGSVQRNWCPWEILELQEGC